MAKKYLSIPPSSAESERLFSLTSNICGNLRTRIKTDKLTKLTLIKSVFSIVKSRKLVQVKK